LGEACRALDFPIVSGNVSLYNETNGVGILPTPAIAGVGLLDVGAKRVGAAFVAEGDAILLIGAPEGWGGHMGQSAYLRDVLGREEGAPPPVDLFEEKRIGDFVRGLIQEGNASSVHDLSDGGLAVALAEMALASGIGAKVDEPDNAIPAFFGEDQGRYLVTSSAANQQSILDQAKTLSISVMILGVTGGKELKLGKSRAISIEDLHAANEGWLPGFMNAAS
jgi:phosphoribosylformylglycinamidine synthase